jgi:hypothetical protein
VSAGGTNREARSRTACYVHKDLHAAFELSRELAVHVRAAMPVEDGFDTIVGPWSDKAAMQLVVGQAESL